MIAGHSIFQAVHPSGVLSDISTDAANHLAGGIWRVIEPIASDGTAHPAVDDTGFHGDRLVTEIDLKNPAHATGHNQQRFLFDESAA